MMASTTFIETYTTPDSVIVRADYRISIHGLFTESLREEACLHSR